jgi:hypothetical protein
MKLKAVIYSILLTISVSNYGFSQSNDLEPERGVFSTSSSKYSYSTTIKSYLFSDLPTTPTVRIVVTSIVQPEYVVSIDKLDEMYVLSTTDLKNNLGKFWKENKEVNIASYSSEKHKTEIGSQITQKLNTLFSLAISQVKYPSELKDTRDTTTYTFISNYDVDMRSGVTSTTNLSEKLKGLIEITDWLHGCAKNEKVVELDLYNKKIDKLLQQFKKG